MFTGIVHSMGTVVEFATRGQEQRLRIEAPQLDLESVEMGDSIAVSGVCLTVVAKEGANFAADVSNETLACTSLGDCRPGAPVNLEPALTPNTALGGHIINGIHAHNGNVIAA